MAGRTDIPTLQHSTAPVGDALQKRHTVAALVYFLYGVFYSLGAQYFTSIGATTRGMTGPKIFFVLGWIFTFLFPLLIYTRFAVALSLYRKHQDQRKNLFINFTLILGILVVIRVIFLLLGGSYKKSFLHSTALVTAAINAACLLWAGLSQPVWITRDAQGP